MIVLKIMYRLVALMKKFFYKLIFGKKLILGKGVKFRKGFSIAIEGDGRIILGKDVSFNNFCSVNALDEITIGDATIFGENVRLYDHNHRFSSLKLSIMEQGYTKAPIHIGSHCWIGSNVTILKGVTIGDNVIIGANCLITTDIPSNSVVKLSQEQVMEVRRECQSR